MNEPINRWGFMGLLLLSVAADAAIDARLQRERITEGETVQLLLEADGQVSGRPDTGPLATDFEILGIASGSRVNVVNGQVDARTSWTITLAPKRSGNLVVPPLELNGEQSSALVLEVIDAGQPVAGSGRAEVLIESEVDRSDPYVQGMVRYTVRLLHRVRLAEGSLSEPQLDNAIIKRLGKDREYTVDRDGQRFRVIERQYAIFPQVSGELRLPAPVLDARVVDRSSRRRSPLQDFFGRDPFDDSFFGAGPLGNAFAETRQLRVRGRAQSLTVQPRPASAGGSWWLPAEHVSLTENWQPEEGPLRVGEPVTRTLLVRARGLTGDQLPDLEPLPTAAFKQYPDQPRASTGIAEQKVEGEKKRSIALVPVQAGKFTLPPVRLKWWDIAADLERVVELPGREVEVLPAIAAQGLPEQSSSTIALDPLPSAEVPEVAVAGNSQGVWPWVSMVFALLWLGTVGAWWRGRKSVAAVSVAEGKAPAGTGSAAAAKQKFLQACRANQPQIARRMLLQWAAAHWPDKPPVGLGELVGRLDDSAAETALTELDRALYSGQQPQWDGAALAAALSQLPESAAGTKQKQLPDLYR